MDLKPVITYTGARSVFRQLESHISTALPQDTCEWRRSYGRPSKNVRIGGTFIPFEPETLIKYKTGDWNIIEHPVLHVYVTDCNDVETYKSSVKEEIDSWTKSLNTYDIQDWMILVIETVDMKKTKNILPRTTVLDKIRLDFAGKVPDKCISLLNPVKYEVKATESFRCVLQRFRHLMLAGYNRNIIKYEEIIRSQRERRNQEGWCFIKYFSLQEQLAFVLEMLGLYSESLVQYDELDALFSQFVLNSTFGEKQHWLQSFEMPINSFHGICIDSKKTMEMREKIISKSASLLEFRTYLFERQATLLKLSDQTCEIAERLLPFMFATLREIESLSINRPDGALQCWQFVCSLVVLDIVDSTIDNKDVTTEIFQFTAPIWNLAKDKLFELGKMCGLLPGFTPTSEQLHIVVQLSAGIGDPVGMDVEVNAERSDKIINSPNRKVKKPATERLKEALGSNKSFQKLYLELSELAISTYKHVSRLRSARLVGLDLGNFYCSLSEPNKAAVFFNDLLRELKTENWTYLASQVLLELATCYQKMNDTNSYTKICAGISCCTDLEILVRTFYFDEFLKGLIDIKSELDGKDELTVYPTTVLDDHLKIIGIRISPDDKIIQDNVITVDVRLDSHFPREIVSSKISLSYEIVRKSIDNLINQSNGQDNKLSIMSNLSYNEDNTLDCASVICDAKSKNLVRRSSSTRRKISPTVRQDFTNAATSDRDVVIKPGPNIIQLRCKASRVGIWCFKQLSVKLNGLELLSESIVNHVKPFEIITKAASAVLSFKDLVAGIEQPLNLIVSGGSFIFPPEATISIKCTKNLKIRISNHNSDRPNEFKSDLIVNLPNFHSFDERTITLEVICSLPGQRDDKHIEHNVSLQCPWSRAELFIPLHFMPALVASCRLHSSGSRKFLQVIVKALSDTKLLLTDALMTCECKGVNLRDNNPKSQTCIGTSKGLLISYIWEIEVEPLKAECELPVIKINFSINYAVANRSDDKRRFTSKFDVMDYTTLFRIQAKIEPSELCRVGSVCHLNLIIIKVHDNPFVDLMYEVLADQNVWAVCGRTAGVVSMFGNEQQSVTLDVMPLSAGFLPLPNIRISKYISGGTKGDAHPKLQPFPPGQVYNSTKSIQVHVLASTNTEHL